MTESRLTEPSPSEPSALEPSPGQPGDDAAYATRIALVTGGAQRIGRAIALGLARDGWDVAVHYHASREAALATVADVQALGRRACALAHDLSGAGPVDGLLDACAEALGPAACLVNNASRFEPDTALDFAREQFEAHMRTNLAAPVLLARSLHARLAPQARGVVVNLLDQKLWNPNPDFFTYTLSKAALETATGLLARALAPRLRVVGVAPGITLPAQGQTQSGFEAAQRSTPLRRGSRPEDIAQAVVYLVNAPAVTGTTLLVDGGQHLVPTSRDIMYLTS
jgi:NAD(P)-dependent dehydrogenase (short-subunit alcohol dehydrogenase family)